MSSSRRTFIRHSVSAALGAFTTPVWLSHEVFAQGADCTLPNAGPAKQLVPDEPKVLERPSAAEMSLPAQANALTSFRAAMQVVRSRPSADVIGWDKLVAQHCIHCARTAPANIHYNWFFLPWHRAMLYLFERILRTAGNSDSLRLPYWDWENPNSRSLPSIYAPKNQSLYWPSRRVSGEGWPLLDDVVQVSGALAIPSFDDFGGTATLGRPTPATFSGPHAGVHNSFGPGDMSDLRFSPRDPVFYAHHANIDRLWSSWSAHRPNPDFGQARVNFFDEKRQWRYILLNDLRDESRLGYRYSSLMSSPVPFSTLQLFQFSGTNGRYAPPATAAARVNAPGPRYLLLRNIENLEKLPADTLRYGIFASNPKVGTDAASDPSYLGRVSRINSSGDQERAVPLSAALDVSDKLPRIAAANNNTLPLLIAGLAQDGKTVTEGIPLVASSVNVIG